MKREVYIKNIISEDGSVAIVDATPEIQSLREKLRMAYMEDSLMSVEEVRQLLKLETKEAVYNKIQKGHFPPSLYLKRKGFPTLFKKKALYRFLGLS
ncbi:helix-turn-helix transcriptional regulator [Flexistipes sp.]|uniref:helix-turn-helix transcriptional regulator n=1 Tax=Flexistipes sp. TaxID=3088135 RepID=UPI002E216EB1|nr:hypothetical protein [Flexistipes sp.]